MANAVLGAFLGVLAIQLCAAAMERAGERQITKALLMPLLLPFYWLKTVMPAPLILLALVFSATGDVFLLSPKK